MSKKENEVLTEGKLKFTLGDPREKAEQVRVEIKRRGKLDAMRIAQTHIEIQSLIVKPGEAIKIADEFLAWLKK